MIEKQFIQAKKREFIIKEFVKKKLGKGKVSIVRLERTPLGERIIVHTTRPGLIIGRKGEAIQELTATLKAQFKLENPQVEIIEITKAEFDAQFMADFIAAALERFGPLRFKSIAYRALQRIMDAKALGAELRLSGKLPSERAKSWRFAFGYLKKTGAPAEIIVNKAYATAFTKPGAVGVKVFIVPPTADIKEIKEKKIVVEEVVAEATQEPTEPVEVSKQQADDSKKVKPKKKAAAKKPRKKAATKKKEQEKETKEKEKVKE